MGLALALTGGCSTTGAKAPSSTTAAASDAPLPEALRRSAGEGIGSARLRSVLERMLDADSHQSPMSATYYGDHRFDDRIDDFSSRAHERMLGEQRAFLEELRQLDREDLSPGDRVTFQLLERDLRQTLELEVCESRLWSLSTLGNALSFASSALRRLPLKTEKERDNYAARLAALAPAFDGQRANLEEGARRYLTASDANVTRVLRIVEGELRRPTREWEVLASLKDLPKELTEKERAAYRGRLEAIVDRDLRPATERYRDTLRNVIRPRAHSDDRPGLVSLPNGEACYKAHIAMFTTQERTAEDLHALGLAELRRANEGMRALGAKVLGTDDLATILKRMRSDASLYFSTSEEVENAARKATERAQRALPEAFETLPKTPLSIEPVPAFQAPDALVGMYQSAAIDGDQPSRFLINTFAPTTRPRFEAEAVAFHEGVPGHHLQIALAQEQRALPLFRRANGVTAFIEGWGLYVERLADDMHLYSSDLDRLGMLSFDAWRSSRLVVDTGLRSLGWSRDQAVRFLFEHTALEQKNIEVEVDRYIGWPGQALAYKVGQLEILRLRAMAQKELGPKFTLRGFHTAVLSQGSVTLGMLEQQVRAWIDATRRATPAAAATPSADPG